jgi:hypothetical protein
MNFLRLQICLLYESIIQGEVIVVMFETILTNLNLVCYNTEQTASRGNDSDLYQGGIQSQSRLGQRNPY